MRERDKRETHMMTPNTVCTHLWLRIETRQAQTSRRGKTR
jgi:hypothetical protein